MADNKVPMNFAVVTRDRERLVNVVETAHFNHDREKALQHARKLVVGWAATENRDLIVVEVPHHLLNHCREINNVNGFHEFRQV